MSAPIATLRDDFEDNSVAAAWSATATPSATVAETGGQARFTLPSSIAGTHTAVYRSISRYDLTAGSFFINIETMVATGVAATAFFDLLIDNNNYLRWRQVSGTITARSVVGGVDTQQYTAAWSISTYKYLRIRESGGNVLFESSTNGTSWTTRATIAAPFAVTDLLVQFGATCGNVANPGSFRLEDVNLILPALTTNWRWTQVVWPLSNRYKVVTIAIDTAGTAQAYVVTADGIDVNGDPSGTVRYFSGPADGGRLLTEQATQAAAQAMAVDIPLDGRLDIPTIVEARCIRIYHRSIDGSAYTLREVYPRRLVQADDIEAESIRALHIAAASITGDRIVAGTITADLINVTQLSAIAADAGTITAGTIDGAIIYAGTSHDVKLDSAGITVFVPVNTPADLDSYKVARSSDGAILGGLYGYYITGGSPAHYVIAKAVSIAGETSTYEIDAVTPSGFTSLVTLRAQRATATDTSIDVTNTSGGGRQVVISGDVFMDAGLNVGTATGTGVGAIGATVADAGTNNLATLLTLTHNSSAGGSIAAGFGGIVRFNLQTTTTPDVLAAFIEPMWATSTGGSQKGRLVLGASDTAGREGLRIEASGSAPMIGFLGAAAVVRQSVAAAAPAGGTGATAGAYDTAAHRDSLITLVNNIRTAGINLGLWA